MMTKKQAYFFKEQINSGQYPLIPDKIRNLLKLSSVEIKNNIAHAAVFDYGNTTKTYADRLVMMGIFDLDYNLTTLGREYLKNN